MNNRVNLQEYLSSFKSVSEKRQLFYAIFEEMHRYHNNGEYLFKLSFQTVSVCFTNPFDIHFSCYKKIGNCSIQEVLDLKFQNILTLTQMMIGSFMEYDFSVPCLCVKVLEKQLSDLRSFLDPVDYAYCEKIFLQKEYLYYDDYIRNLEQKTFIPFQEKRKLSEQEEAFTTYFLLSVNLVVVVLLFVCLFMYM